MAATKAQKSVEEEPVGTQVTNNEAARNWRIACFEEQGFSINEAKALADAIVTRMVSDKKGVRFYDSPLHHSRTQKMLGAGASYAEVLEICL